MLIPLDSVQVANFEYVGEEETLKQAEGDNDAEDLDPDAKAKYWDELLKQRYEEQQQRDAAAELGKGKRARKQVCYLVLIWFIAFDCGFSLYEFITLVSSGFGISDTPLSPPGAYISFGSYSHYY